MDGFLRRFRDVVVRQPDKCAVSDAARALSYRELDADSDRLAALLHADAGGENRIYGYLGRMTAECVSLNVAAGKSGTAVVALDPGDPDSVLRELIGHSGLANIVATAEHAERARLLTGKAPIVIPLAPPDRDAIAVFAPIEADPDALHFIAYTSGSTGRPKGVIVTRRITDIRWEQKLDFYGTRETDVCAMFSTFWWYKHVWPLTVGAEVACFDFAGRGLAELDGWMRQKQITVLLTYLAMYRQLAETANTPFPALRQVIVGGELTRVSDVRRFDEVSRPGAEMIIRLACQELGPITMFVHSHGDSIDYEVVPLGRFLRPERYRLLDAEGREVPDGQPGEIVASGPFVPPGYHNDPERTSAAFRRDADGRWNYYMGDLVRRDPDGMLHPMGRRDQQVKIRGFTVRPHEIEEKLTRHSGIVEAAVTAFEGARGIRRLAGFYVPAGPDGPTPAELRGYLSESLPNYQVPSTLIRCDGLPRTANGKLDRKALPDPLAANSGGVLAVDAARTEDERVLARLWAEVLGHQNFGLDDDFFDVGGDSLQAMTMLVGAERELTSRVPLEFLALTGASISDLAAQFEANRNGGSEFSTPRILKNGGDRPPIYAAHVQGGHMSDYVNILSLLNDQPVYGLHPRGLYNSAPADMTMAALADYCAESIMRNAPSVRNVRIMGYSFGGILAFETARHVEAKGGEVSHLILIDPPAIWIRSMRLARAVRTYLFGGRRTAGSAGRILSSTRAVLGMGPPPDSLDDAHFIACARYRPMPFAARNALLISCTNHPLRDAYRDEWQRLIGPGLTCTRSPGTHHQMVRPPHHEPLARAISEWLENGVRLETAA